MARITKGILGGFSGKVGTVIGSTWRGVDYMRSRPTKKRGNPSEAQLDQQQKFKLVQGFLNSFSPLLPIGFKTQDNLTAHNSALSYNLKNGIGGGSPNFTLQFNQLLVSRGSLPNATGIAAVKTGNDIKFTWTDNSGNGTAQPTDSTLLVVYCPSMGESIYSLGTSQRVDASESVDCSRFAGKQVETYIGFVSVDGKIAANSMYAASINL
jgi:hypothetical protein